MNRVACSIDNGELWFLEESPLNRIIKSASSHCVLTKRVAYLSAFVEYRCCQDKTEKLCDLNWTLMI